MLSEEDIFEIDQFLSSQKTLTIELPNWTKSSRPDEYEARWPLKNESGISIAHVIFRFNNNGQISISLIFRNKPIWRLDIVDEGEIKPNPHDAHNYDLPPNISGNHEHQWNDNKEYIRRNGLGTLPYRRPLQPQIRQFRQAMGHFMSVINVETDRNTWQFDLPSEQSLPL
ncbi:hypothetical protein [Candidatus Puniceispirillum sp.]|uniref:hypothetical protein n=1 Tax=Candidatus Puniceispirillum sp. TaxID=2026719 RepID=UPI003F69AA8F